MSATFKGTLEMSGVVAGRGHYMFLVQYFNPDNTPVDVGVLLQNDHYYEGTVFYILFSLHTLKLPKKAL